MGGFAKLSVLVGVCLAVAACSNGSAPVPATSAPAAPSARAPAASAIPMQAPAAGASAETPPPPPLSTAPSLAVILQRPGFARAFADMAGASALPAWARGGDASAPSARVQVDGKTMWLSHVCQAADCQGDQVFLLTDPARHAMQGLLVEASGSAGDSVRRLTWLGKPGASVQAFLNARVPGD